MTIDVDALKARVRIEDVVGEYVSLKKRGAELVALCPFHADNKLGSFWVIPQKGFCHCFSCGANKDVIEFLMEIEGIDFKTACSRLGAKDWKPKQFAPEKPVVILPDRVTSKPPPDAGTPDMDLYHLGSPSRTWAYRDNDGGILGHVARYDTPEGKEIRCFTWGTRNPKRGPSWDCGQWNKPRPLYGLDRLHTRPDAPVVIVEGEKAADRAKELLPDYVAITWPGGAQAWHKCEWSPVVGRKLLLWPDNDPPGFKCMRELAEWLADPRTFSCHIRMIDPLGMADGFDAADFVGTTAELIAWAKPRASDYIHPSLKQREVERSLEPPPHVDLPPYEQDDDEPIKPKPVNGHDSKSPVIYRRMADIQAERTVWLWPDRIACGEISILTGNPGLGKSQISASLTAVVTNGGTWPVDRTQSKRGSVIILSAEDNTSKTIRPRLDAAGADVSRVYVLDAVRHLTPQGEEVLTGFSLSEDIAKLGHMIHELGDVRLVIIDPISAYLGDIDSHNNAEVRGMLAPLQKVAEAHDTAILCVTHQNKSSGMDALLKLQGSVAFGAAARAVWGVAKDKENPQRRYFMSLKNNLGKDNTGLAYSIESHFIDSSDPDAEKIPTSRVLWEAEPVTKSAEEIFSPSDMTHDEKGAVSEGKAFLRSLLADGPVESKQVEIDARGAGHSMTTLRRAAAEIGVRIAKEGYGRGGRWTWSL